MSVALVCPDGLSVLLFCKGIIRQLQDGGHTRVVVVTEVGEHREELAALGVTVCDLPMHRFIDPLGDLQFVRALVGVLRRERCTGILNFSTKSNIYGAIAARLAGVNRIVSHVVGLGAAFLPDPSLRGRVVRVVMRVLYRLCGILSHRVWFTNRNDLEYFVEQRLVRRRKTLLTRNYLDTNEYASEHVVAASLDELRAELALSANTLVVVMVARLIWAKGIREFVDAARLLRESHPHVMFLLVAPPEPPSPHTVPEDWVTTQQQHANFRWLGFRRDVRRLYALSAIAVLPSYYKEGGYPRALLEPMAMGKPVITTTSEDCRGTVDEGVNGLLVPPRDAGALAAAIATLLDDRALRARYGAASYDKARREFDEAAILAGALTSVGLVPAPAR